MDKKEILRKIIEELEKEVRSLKKSIGTIHKTAVEAPGAMESHSDTTKSQMQRLEAKTSEALSSKERELKALRHFVPKNSSEKIEIGSLFEVEEKERMLLFFLEGGAGITVGRCTVITPRAPISRAFLGKKKGDKVIVELPSGSREYTIINVL